LALTFIVDAFSEFVMSGLVSGIHAFIRRGA
jgi:hypothetical protein